MFPNMNLLVVLLAFCTLCASQQTCSIEDVQTAFDEALTSHGACHTSNLQTCENNNAQLQASADDMQDTIDQLQEDKSWIIIQRRVDGAVNFYQSWYDYKDGFGDFRDGSFWMGNEIIHLLTSHNGDWELRVDLTYGGQDYYALYSSFSLSGANDNYRLTVSGYSGTAGDDLSYHNGKQFSAKDMDNDESAPNCGQQSYGGWWYSGSSCHQSNLNGKWNSGMYGNGMNWKSLTGYEDFVTFSEMKIRQVS